MNITGPSATPAATPPDDSSLAYSPRPPPKGFSGPSKATREKATRESEDVAHVVPGKHVRGIAIATAVAVVLASAFPPFQYRWGNYVTDLGYSFLFSPARLNNSSQAVGSVNLSTLFAEYVGILAIGALSCLLQAWVQYNLGIMYDKGRGVTQDYVRAVKWFRKAAEQANGPAQYSLGYMYHVGHGVTQDHAEAAKWFRKAADQGNGPAQYNLGYMYRVGHGVTQDHAEAAKWFRKAADQGDAHAQWFLGFTYQHGQGVTRNYPLAATWYRKAADQGNMHAQYSLGFLYENGHGLSKNSAEAVKLYRKAADQGNTEAQAYLGLLYMTGGGIPKDCVQAHKWYTLASAHMLVADQRNRVLRSRDAVAAKMTRAQVAEAEKLAREWKPTRGSRRCGRVPP